MKEKKKSKKGTICKAIVITLAAVGTGYLAYKKIPTVKTFIDEALSSLNKKTTADKEIKTKPFRKYETFNKKK